MNDNDNNNDSNQSEDPARRAQSPDAGTDKQDGVVDDGFAAESQPETRPSSGSFSARSPSDSEDTPPPPETISNFTSVDASNIGDYLNWIDNAAYNLSKYNQDTLYRNFEALRNFTGTLDPAQLDRLLAFEHKLSLDKANQAAFTAWQNININRFCSVQDMQAARQRLAEEEARSRDSSASTSLDSDDGGAEVDAGKQGEFGVKPPDAHGKDDYFNKGMGGALVAFMRDSSVDALRHSWLRTPYLISKNLMGGIYQYAKVGFWALLGNKERAAKALDVARATDSSVPAMWQMGKLLVKIGLLAALAPISLPVLLVNKTARDDLSKNLKENYGALKKEWENCALYDAIKWAITGGGFLRFLPPIKIGGVVLNRYGKFTSADEKKWVESKFKDGKTFNEAAFLLYGMSLKEGLGNNPSSAEMKKFNGYKLSRMEERLDKLEDQLRKKLNASTRVELKDQEKLDRLDIMLTGDQKNYARYLKEREVALREFMIGKNTGFMAAITTDKRLKPYDPNYDYQTNSRFAVHNMAASHRASQLGAAIENNDPTGGVKKARQAVQGAASVAASFASSAKPHLDTAGMVAADTVSVVNKVTAGTAIAVGAVAATVGAGVPIAISAATIAAAHHVYDAFMGNESKPHLKNIAKQLEPRLGKVGRGVLHNYSRYTQLKGNYGFNNKAQVDPDSSPSKPTADINGGAINFKVVTNNSPATDTTPNTTNTTRPPAGSI